MPPFAGAPSVQSVIDSVLAFLDLTPLEARQNLIRLATIWGLTWIAWQLVKRVARRIVKIADDHHADTVTLREKRAQTVAQLLRSAGWGLLIALAIYQTLIVFVPKADTTIVGLGAALGLAVGFGAQSLMKDYLNGFFIIFESQFVVGDSIEAAGKAGTVERLTLRTVRIRDIEGVVHIIPNSLITTLSNKTRGWSRAVVDVAISYENDIDGVIAVLKDVAKKFGADESWAGRFDGAPEVLGVESFGDNGVTIRTLLRTKPGLQGEVAREFRRRVMIRLEREGIKGARSHQTINVQTSPLPAAAPAPVAAQLDTTTPPGTT
jgi:moderate conductance mechanosensitive channel